MSAVSHAPALPELPARGPSVLRLSAGRLLRLELRRNAVKWIAPLIITMFWFDAYRTGTGVGPLWSPRTQLFGTSHNYALMDFAPFVTGAAAWAGSRDGRYGTGEQLGITALPRWAARLAMWAATTCWAMAIYAGCVGVVLGTTASQGATGTPLWWPIAVGAAGVAAFSTLGFAAGTLLPSRFTPPFAAIAAMLVLMVSTIVFGETSPYLLLSPMNHQVDPDAQAGVLFPYLPDLAKTQVILLAGLTVAGLGTLGLRAGAGLGGGRRPRVVAAIVTAAGLAASVVSVGLVGTARIEANGVVIPALHDAADDRLVSAPQACSASSVPVCLNPVYKIYLPNVSTALDPVLREMAGLPGAPTRVAQVVFGSEFKIPVTATVTGDPAVLDLGLNIGYQGPMPPGGVSMNSGGCCTSDHLWSDPRLVTEAIRPLVAIAVVNSVVGHANPAQQAVSTGLLIAVGVPQTARPFVGPPADPEHWPLPTPGTPADAAAHRFAALSAADRHAWLTTHLTALRTGQIALEQLP